MKGPSCERKDAEGHHGSPKSHESSSQLTRGTPSKPRAQQRRLLWRRHVLPDSPRLLQRPLHRDHRPRSAAKSPRILPGCHPSALSDSLPHLAAFVSILQHRGNLICHRGLRCRYLARRNTQQTVNFALWNKHPWADLYGFDLLGIYTLFQASVWKCPFSVLAARMASIVGRLSYALLGRVSRQSYALVPLYSTAPNLALPIRSMDNLPNRVRHIFVFGRYVDARHNPFVGR